jgi:hypothetical protein
MKQRQQQVMMLPACTYPFPCQQRKLIAKEKRLVCASKTPCNQQSFDPEKTKQLDKAEFEALRQKIREEKLYRSVEYAKKHPKKFKGLVHGITKKTHRKPSQRRPKQVQDDVLEQYINRGEQGDLPILHAGADVSRPLNAMRIAEYHKCKDCQLKPVVFVAYKTAKGDKRKVRLCFRHWEGLAPTVIGWSGE